jgi:SAM-dependent methyltransferase
MARSDAEKWDAKYADGASRDTKPIPFLVDNVALLGSGSALVLAAGCGRNAVYLAKQGFDVTAIDVSEVGLEQCRQLARSHDVTLKTVCADLDEYDLGRAQFDLITMIYFYEPKLFPGIRAALKPGSRFLFHTFSQNHARVGTFGPKSPDYLASKDSVLQSFTSDTILQCDEATITEDGDTEAVLQFIVSTA